MKDVYQRILTTPQRPLSVIWTKQLRGIKLLEPERWQNVNPAKNQVILRDGTQL